MNQHDHGNRRGFPWKIFLLWVLSLLWAGAGWAENGIRYDVRLEGDVEPSLREDLEFISNTAGTKDRPPATIVQLQRRADDDVPVFIQVLRSQGYYEAVVEVSLDEEKDPVMVTFRIQPGPPYLLRSIRMEVPPGYQPAEKDLPSPQDIGLVPGERARAAVIVGAQENLVLRMKRKGYAIARVVDRHVVVDHEAKGVFVTFTLDPGQVARFGATEVSGLESVKEDYIQKLVKWKQGDRFDVDLLTDLQKRLTETGLFSMIQVNHAEKVDDRGLLPISVVLRERKHRSVGAGVRYFSDEGVGVKFSWEDRNLFNRGERLYVGVIASETTYTGEASFRKPAFLRDDQLLQLSFKLADDDTDAYTSRNMQMALLVDRELSKEMRVGAGPEFRVATVDDAIRDNQDFALISFPSYFKWDTTDNLLDPTRGGRFGIQGAPFLDTLGTDLSFFKALVSYSRYQKLVESPFILLAGRVAVGSISGADRDSIPADIRFYSGGGGSVRGYSYQSIGPLIDGQPVGGSSVFEVSAELRTRITGNIGLVVFLDGGGVFDSAYPDFDQTIRWGTGAGLRYFTPIGPLRFDVGFPLNRRSAVDDAFQIYLSLGQAF